MRKFNHLYIPIDITNSTNIVKIDNYKQLFNNRLLMVSNLDLSLKVIGIFEEANKLIETFKFELASQ